jgi:type VI secretion system secreted protein Hcp
MAYDAFLKIDGITGETTGQDFIEVLSFSFGITHPVAPSGAGAGKPSEIQFEIVKRTDKTSPALFQACATGKVLRQAELDLLPAVQTEKQPFYKVQLGNVLISAVQVSGSEGGDERPIESVSFAFTKIDLFSDGNETSFSFNK